MTNKTKEELEEQLKELETQKKLDECMLNERQLSDKLYAKILVEKIVYTTIGVIALGFLYLLLTTIKWR